MLAEKEFKAKNPSGLFPFLETPKGNLFGVIAITKFLAKSAGKLLGSNAKEQAQVDQWINWSINVLQPTADQVMRGIFAGGQDGIQVQQGHFNDAAKEIKMQAKQINNALTANGGFLVGGALSIADILVALALVKPFQTFLDGGFRKAMAKATEWAEKMYALAEVKAVFGAVKMCAKAFKPICLPDPAAEKKKEEKKKAAPAPAAAPKKKEEKPKDNVEALPPTNFNVYDFKTLYVNHKDKKGAAVDTWYEMLDWEGWSFWFFHYDIYEDEGAKLHVTNNLMNGFLNRAEHTSKYTFARQGVFGEEPNLEIMGVWLVRGQEIPDGLKKEHPQMEYYKTKKLDPRNNKDDDKMVREFFGGAEGEMINGLKCQTLKWHK